MFITYWDIFEIFSDLCIILVLFWFYISWRRTVERVNKANSERALQMKRIALFIVKLHLYHSITKNYNASAGISSLRSLGEFAKTLPADLLLKIDYVTHDLGLFPDEQKLEPEEEEE